MFKKIMSVVLFGVLLLATAALAVDYSCRSITVTRVGTEEEVTEGKAYVTKDKWRAEAITDKEKTAITIFRYDKEVMWILMPEEKMYMEQKIPMKDLIAAASEIEKELEKEMNIKVYRKRVGKEKISGILCYKYKITVKDLSEKKPKTYTMYHWISIKHKGLIMKTAFDDGSYNQLKDLKFKKQPAYLFEIPKGYKKFSMRMPRMVEEEEGVAEEGEVEVEEEEEEVPSIPLPKFRPPIRMPF